jgi:hypothetical protein
MGSICNNKYKFGTTWDVAMTNSMGLADSLVFTQSCPPRMGAWRTMYASLHQCAVCVATAVNAIHLFWPAGAVSALSFSTETLVIPVCYQTRPAAANSGMHEVVSDIARPLTSCQQHPASMVHIALNLRSSKMHKTLSTSYVNTLLPSCLTLAAAHNMYCMVDWILRTPGMCQKRGPSAEPLLVISRATICSDQRLLPSYGCHASLPAPAIPEVHGFADVTLPVVR